MSATLNGVPANVTAGAVGGAVTPGWGTATRTAGDDLYLCVVGRSLNTLPSTPAGWSIVAGSSVQGTNCCAIAYHKTAAGGDAAPTVGAVASQAWVAGLLDIQGLGSVVDQVVSFTSTGAAPTGTMPAHDATPRDFAIYFTALNLSSAGANTITLTPSANVGTTNDVGWGNNNATSTTIHYQFRYNTGAVGANSAADSLTTAYTNTNVNGFCGLFITLAPSTAVLSDTETGVGDDEGNRARTPAPQGIQLANGVEGAVVTPAQGNAATPAWNASNYRNKGNLLVCVIAGQGAATLPTIPSGWSIMSDGTTSAQETSTNVSLTFISQVASGGDAAPTIPGAANVSWQAQLWEFEQDSLAASPIDHVAITAATSGTSVTITATGPDVAADGVLAGIAVHYAGGSTRGTGLLFGNTYPGSGATVPTGVDNDSSNSTNHYRFGYASTLYSNQATTAGTYTWTGAPQGVAGLFVTLIPAVSFVQDPTEGGSGADAVTVIGHPDTDAGQSSDTAAPALSLSVADTGSSSEAIGGIALSSSDSGSGSDTALSIAFSSTDSGVGSDAVSPTLSLSVTDSGSGAEGSQTLYLSVTDAGAGVDLTSIDLSDADSGAATEAVGVVTVVGDTDAGSGAEASQSLGLSDTDTASGTERPGLIGFSSSDSGSGTEDSALIGLSGGSDSGSGATEGTGISVYSADAGNGVEAAGSLTLSATDAGASVEASLIFVYSSDAGQGIETLEHIPTGRMSVWDGLSWTPYIVRVWSGSAWIQTPIKRWDGSNWMVV